MEWVRGHKIGCGSFGTVDLAILRSQGSEIPSLMAVKTCDASCSASLVNEKSKLDELRGCPEIIRCLGDGLSFENGGKLYNVLLEYASGGALADKLTNLGDNRLPESEARRYARSILKGLHFIHEKGFVHCDIKLQNILVFSSENGANDEVKIADFGLTKKAGTREGNLKSELRGTPLYMSPEMVAGGEQEKPADIWALGCVVVELLTGAPAWRCSDLASLLMRIGVGEEVPEIPAKISDQGKDFLGKCFLKDPRQRWTAEMLLNHPFVADQGDDRHDADTVTAKDKTDVASTSPRSLFDFPDWVSTHSSSVTSSIASSSTPESEIEENSRGWSVLGRSPADRVQQLALSNPRHDWSVSASWVTVR